MKRSYQIMPQKTMIIHRGIPCLYRFRIASAEQIRTGLHLNPLKNRQL